MGTVVGIYAVGEPRKGDISFVKKLAKETKDVVVVFFYDDYAGFDFFERYKKAFDVKTISFHKIKIPGPIYPLSDPVLVSAGKIIDLTRGNVDDQQFPQNMTIIKPATS